MNTPALNLSESSPINRLVSWYETLTPASLAVISQIYTDDAYFRDPFNEVTGIALIRHIMADMFEHLENPRFVFTDRIVDGQSAFVAWQFLFNFRGKSHVIDGSTLLRFAPDGRVNYHRDYWDAAGELYEKFPVLGGVLRFFKRKLRVESAG